MKVIISQNNEIPDILYFESVDNLTFIYTEDKILTSKLRLYEIEGKLCDRDFFRFSKSVIVNLRKIRKLKMLLICLEVYTI